MEISVDLSKRSLNAAIRQLKQLKKSLPDKIERKNQQLVEEGKNILDTNISNIPNFDGNDKGMTFGTAVDLNAKIEWQGEQVQFLEFGTGIVGSRQAYEGELPPGWEYGKGKYSGRHEDGHWHYSKNGGEPILTYGIPAYAPMLHASEELKTKIAEIYKGLLGGNEE